jgi:hypothetical protein
MPTVETPRFKIFTGEVCVSLPVEFNDDEENQRIHDNIRSLFKARIDFLAAQILELHPEARVVIEE